MKKLIVYIMTIILTLSIIPVQTYAATKEKSSSSVVTKPKEITEAESTEAKALVNRLDEIKAMDKSKLKSNEKKNLHKEVKTIKRRLKDISGGLYISAGTLIIILILLVILT
jgi:hypothetical protein